MSGSGIKPYVLKNTGGVYSCSCPAWRNQSVAIKKRTCKHLRKLSSRYEAGRSTTLLKVKTFHDAEAVVIGHEAGRGKHKGRLGALRMQLPDGTEFSLGTGFSDKERQDPPPIGTSVTFRYQELSDGGVPRFPSFLGVRPL